MPNGVAFRDGALYVAEIIGCCASTNRSAAERAAQTGRHQRQFSERQHTRLEIYCVRTGRLALCAGGRAVQYLRADSNRYANLQRMRVDGAAPEVFARGIRNTVGFDWHPQTKQFWFTDNGRDRLGDDVPPDELNHAAKAGLHFGYPHCHGGDIADPEFGKSRRCKEFTPPAQKLGPHVAALGMRFYTGSMFPAEYRNQIFIAEHGSWNRSTPLGYRITLVQLKDNQAVSYKPFAEGWLQGSRAWGRPVDVLVMPDGALLVSDDEAGAIYRIAYKK